MSTSKMLTIEQVSDFWQLSPRTIRRRIAEGRLVGYRDGRILRFKPEDVAAMFTPTNKWSGGDD